MLDPWIFWLIAAILLLILELLTFAAAALCVSVGCLLAIIPALLGCSWTVQVLVAVVGIVFAFIVFAPIVKRVYSRRPHRDTASNMDAIIGRVGKVTHEVTSQADDKGRVQIDGDSWLAYTTSPECPIPRGEQVIVEAYDSLVLRVRPLKKQ